MMTKREYKLLTLQLFMPYYEHVTKNKSYMCKIVGIFRSTGQEKAFFMVMTNIVKSEGTVSHMFDIKGSE